MLSKSQHGERGHQPSSIKRADVKIETIARPKVLCVAQQVRSMANLLFVDASRAIH